VLFPTPTHKCPGRRAALALALVLAVGCAPTFPATCVPGRIVELHVDLPPDDAARFAREAEAFVSDVSRYLGVPPPKARVYVFGSGWRLRRYLNRECAAFHERAGACFEASDGRLTVALAAADAGCPETPVLRHELTHAVIAANVARPMPWLDEGLAQVFERGCPPVDDPGRRARLTDLAPRIGPRLTRLLRLERHAQLDRTDYLIAWGFTWFLLHDRADGRRVIRACLGPPALGETPFQRAARGLGAPPDEFAREFIRSLRP